VGWRAFFNLTAWNALVLFGLRQMPAGRSAILAYTMPVWATVIAALVLSEPLGKRKAFGLALGMAGMLVLQATYWWIVLLAGGAEVAPLEALVAALVERIGGFRGRLRGGRRERKGGDECDKDQHRSDARTEHAEPPERGRRSQPVSAGRYHAGTMTPIHFRSLRRIFAVPVLCTTFVVSVSPSAGSDLVPRNLTLIDGRARPPGG